jgi:signal transduction histidine kinase
MATLVILFALTALLAIEAFRAIRLHRSVAREALRDYATQVGWTFSERVRSKLSGEISPALALQGSPSLERTGNDRTHRTFLLLFSFNIASEQLLVNHGSLSSEEQAWLVETLRHTAVSHDDETTPRLHALAGPRDTGDRLFVYARNFGDREGGWLGLEVSPELLSTALERGFVHPLLPPFLTRGRANADLLSIRVKGPSGKTVFASQPVYDFDSVASLPLFSDGGQGFDVEVALRPELVEGLLIGRKPGSRLAMVLALLALAAALTVSAVWLLGRQRSLARLRANFIANVSHELRTPLAQISMFAEMLRLNRTRTKEEYRRSLKIIDQETRRLTFLVSNILTFHRRGAVPVPLVREALNLTALVSDTLEAFRPLADARDVTLKLVTSGPRFCAVANRDSLRQILVNLLDNAVKYGPVGGGVTVRLERVGRSIRLSVEDQGRGVPVHMRQDVWRPFWRLEDQEMGPVAGTGIGLAVVKDLADRMRARHWVEDVEGGGARFVVEFEAEAKG